MNAVITTFALLVVSVASLKNMCRVCQELEDITINTEDEAMATMITQMMESMLEVEGEDSPFVKCSNAEMQPCNSTHPDCLSFRITGEQRMPNPNPNNNANGDDITLTMTMDMAMCGIADLMTCDVMESQLGIMAGVEDDDEADNVSCEADVDVWAEEESSGTGGSGAGNSGAGGSGAGNSGAGNSGAGNNAPGVNVGETNTPASGGEVGEKCRPCMEMTIETEDEAMKTMMETMMGGGGGEDSPFVKCSTAEEIDCGSELPDCVKFQLSGDMSVPNPSGGDNIELGMKYNMAMCGISDAMTCEMMEENQGAAMSGVSNLECKTGDDVSFDGNSSSTSTASMTLLLSVFAYLSM